MIQYLSGAINATVLANPRPDLGLMLSPGMGNNVEPLKFWAHAFDNGCFAQGKTFVPGDWLEWLAGLRRYRERTLFAVAPDVVGDAESTLERSVPYLPTVRQLGFPVAFVTQNGCRFDLVPWDGIDCLFVGGDDTWKMSRMSWALCAEAKRRGLWVHVGRVNSFERLMLCALQGVDSADGTYLKYGPDVNWPKLMGWLDEINALARLPQYQAEVQRRLMLDPREIDTNDTQQCDLFSEAVS